MKPDADRLLIVTGLNAEARIAVGPGCRVLAGGGDRAGLATKLDAEDPNAFAAVISFGVAGGLASDLPVGALVLAARIAQPGSGEEPVGKASPALRLRADAVDRLARAGLVVREGAVAGVDSPATTAEAKRELHRETGALAVDMESHVAAAYAARHGLPFLAIRVISDGAEHAIPPAAAAAMRPDGSVDVPGLLLALARRPGQIPGLVATARNAAVAFRALRRVRRLLGSGFGLHL